MISQGNKSQDIFSEGGGGDYSTQLFNETKNPKEQFNAAQLRKGREYWALYWKGLLPWY